MAYIDVLAPTYRPKHPTMVHVWAGISRRGSAGIYMYIFEGIMKKELYAGAMLVLFIKDVFPATRKFMQDNDLKRVELCQRLDDGKLRGKPLLNHRISIQSKSYGKSSRDSSDGR